MKTDLVLTIDEYLDECGVVPHKANPPAPEARHVPITANEDVELDQEENGNRCDRWGHQLAICRNPKPQALP